MRLTSAYIRPKGCGLLNENKKGIFQLPEAFIRRIQKSIILKPRVVFTVTLPMIEIQPHQPSKA
jgi:hypothetical protein